MLFIIKFTLVIDGFENICEVGLPDKSKHNVEIFCNIPGVSKNIYEKESVKRKMIEAGFRFFNESSKEDYPAICLTFQLTGTHDSFNAAMNKLGVSLVDLENGYKEALKTENNARQSNMAFSK